MSFREKIDNILKYNKLGINSPYGLEVYVKASPGAISKPLNKGEEPGLGTIKKIREGLPGLNQGWWDTGKGDVFVSNITYDDKASNNKLNGMNPRETFYEELMEKNKDYFVAPRSIFTDYKIVPDKIIDVIIASNEGEKKALRESMETAKEALIKDYERLIEGLENKAERLEKEKEKLKEENEVLKEENEDLRRQIPGKD